MNDKNYKPVSDWVTNNNKQLAIIQTMNTALGTNYPEQGKQDLTYLTNEMYSLKTGNDA